MKAFRRIGRRSLLFLLVAVSLFALVAVACGDDDDDDGGDEETATATTEATSAAEETPTSEESPEPTEPATEPSGPYPVEVTDLLDRSVTIEALPTTIVAISPTAVEFVYAAGAEIAGRSESVTFPPEAAEAPSIGTAYQPSFEAILALEPDLIVADSVIHSQPQYLDPLEDLGVPVVFAGAENMDDVIAGLELMGQVFDSSDETDALIAEINDALEAAQAAIAGQDVSAILLIADRDNTLYGAKTSSYAGDILDKLGITNPAADQPDAGPFPGYTALAPELILQFDPAYIFTVTPAPPPAPRLSDIVANQIPPFQGLRAVQTGQVIELDLEVFLQAPGPRIGNAFEALADAITGGGE